MVRCATSVMTRRLRLVVAFSGYLCTAIVVTWPLAASLTTHLPADPSGDTGIYAWNLWVFAREVGTAHGPFFTDAVFPLTGQVDLSLHNYTVASGLLALPFIGWLGTVGAFNVVFMLQLVLAAFGLYLLARELTACERSSWMAGVVFACSPVLAARASGHFSLVAAAPLPLFVLASLRAIDGPHVWRAAAAAGACIAWAAYSDAYYGVYCLFLLAVILVHRALVVAPPVEGPWRAGEQALLGVAVIAFAIGIAIRLTGGADCSLGGTTVYARTAYTPMLCAAAACLILAALRFVPRLGVSRDFPIIRVGQFLVGCGAVATLTLSPLLFAMLQRVLDGRWVPTPQFWRSSTPGLDLLAFVLPNPSHSMLGGPARALLESWRPDAFPEFVGSLPLVALATLAVVRLRQGRWPDGTAPWRWLFVAALLLSLGPFLSIAGVNTHVPGPWALLRYVPVLGWARAPSRFAVLSTLALCVLFAFALRDLLRQRRGRFAIVAPLLAALAFEHLSIPRPVFAAVVPDIYDVVAADPNPDVRVLELPVGIRDGLGSLGNARPLAQFYQTRHGKSVVGGYLSRVSHRRRRDSMSIPTLRALIELSQGTSLEDQVDLDGRLMAGRFVQRSRIGYVVINRKRASPGLRAWAIEALGLTLVAERDGRELYRPSAWPPDMLAALPGRRFLPR